MLCSTATASATDENVKVVIGYGNQTPFQFTNDQGEAKGIDIARISTILDHAGIDYEFQEYPWKRILRMLQTGQLDIAMGAAKLKEREAYARFSNHAFNHGANVLMVKSELAVTFENMPSLLSIRDMDVTIGVRRGASYSDEYESLLSDSAFTIKLITLTNVLQAMEMTIAGRISGFIGHPQMITFEAMKACIKNDFVQVYDLLANENLDTFLMYSKKTISPAIAMKIDQAMREVNSASDEYPETYTPPTFNCQSK